MTQLNDATDIVLNGETVIGAYLNGVKIWPASGSVPSGQPVVISSTPILSPTFPITVAANNRGLIDALGNPFVGIADTAWQAISRMTQAEFTEYITRRRAQGYTTVLISILDIRSRTRVQDASGQTPFTATGNSASLASPLSTGSYSYWDHVEWVVDECASYGMLAVLVPCWYGGWGDMWRGHIASSANDTTIATSYGSFLASLLGDRTNVWWLLGGDDGPTTGGNNVTGVPAGLPRVDVTIATNALAVALKSGASVEQLMTYHTVRNDTAWTYFGSESWYDLHAAYADQDTAACVTAEWERVTQKPIFMVEAYYDMREEVGVSLPYLTRVQERAQAWQAMLAGARMSANGNEAVWSVKGQYAGFTWRDGIDSLSGEDLTVISRVFATWPNKQFLSDVSTPLVTSGAGTGVYASFGSISEDAKVGIVYFPSERSATINLSLISGNPSLAWIHPETGVLTSIMTNVTANTYAIKWPDGWSDAIFIAESL